MKPLRYLFLEFISLIFYFSAGCFWLKLLLRSKPILIILNYHNFSKYNNYAIKRGAILESGYAGNFERQIKFIKKHFNFCYPEIFFTGSYKSGLNVLITFDDGYKDNYEVAVPVLERYKAATIFFLTTNYIGTNKWLWHDKARYLISKKILDSNKTEAQLKKMNFGYQVKDELITMVEQDFPEVPPQRMMLKWEEAKDIHSRGFRLGTHTSNHVLLNSLTKELQSDEIKTSKSMIESRIHINCIYLAYPNGHFNKDTLNLMDENDIEYGFTTVSGSNCLDSEKKKLKRIGINASDSVQVLLLKIFINLFK